MSRPVLVGESPPTGASVETISPLFPVPSAGSGARLQRMTGLGRAEYMRRFARINLVSTPGKPGIKKARWAAVNLMRGGILSGCSVVLLGSRVAAAFGLSGLALMTWMELSVSAGIGLSPVRVALLPHPSGMCRWYNDSGNLKRAIAFLSTLAEEGESG